MQLVRVDGNYDRDSGLFRETIRVEAPAAGRIDLLFQCPRDPVYQSAECRLHSRKDAGDEPADPDGVWKEIGAPVLSTKATLADARVKSEWQVLAKAEADKAAASAKEAAEVRAGTLNQAEVVGTVSVQTPVARLPTPATATQLPAGSALRAAGRGTEVLLPLGSTSRVDLEDGSYLTGRAAGRARAVTPLWHHIDPSGQVRRVYPDGTRAYRQADRLIVLDVGGTRVELGRVKP
jgi:hypothetical protein